MQRYFLSISVVVAVIVGWWFLAANDFDTFSRKLSEALQQDSLLSEQQLFIPSKANLKSALSVHFGHLERLRGFESEQLSPLWQAKYKVFETTLSEKIAQLKSYSSEPAAYDLLPAFAEKQDDVETLEKWLAQAPEFFEAGKSVLKCDDPAKLQAAISAQQQFYFFLQNDLSEKADEEALASAQLAVKDFVGFLNSMANEQDRNADDTD